MTRRALMKLAAASVSAAYVRKIVGQTTAIAMAETKTQRAGAELVIVPPRQSPQVSDEFVARCVIAGVHFHSEAGDVLPDRVPAGLDQLRAIVIEEDEVAANADVIARYEAAGACVYRMGRSRSATVPNATLAWAGEKTFHTICFDADLTINHPAGRAELLARPDDRLFNDLGNAILQSENTRWYDAPRYQWECMMDGFAVTGDHQYLEVAQKQMLHAIEKIPNDLSNCDCVAPLVPVLSLYEVTKDQRLLDYAVRTFDEYLKVTPLHEGCLVNFGVYGHHVRSEILWQVLPGLLQLARISGNDSYHSFAVDQFEKLYRLLFDEKQSLWAHGYGKGRRTPGFWARGVAFGFLGHLIVLEHLTPNDRHFEMCRDSFVKGANRLRELQDKHGFWCCVPDRADSAQESSGTAWICAGMERAIRLGLLDSSFRASADLAWDAVKSRIWQGRFPGHMTATTVSQQSEYYLKIGLSDSGWAHFAFRAMCERKRTAMAKA